MSLPPPSPSIHPRVPSIARIDLVYEASPQQQRSSGGWATIQSAERVTPYSSAKGIIVSTSLLLSQSTGRDKVSGLIQYALCCFCTFLRQKQSHGIVDPMIEHRYAAYKGFERALSNARKMMKFGKWLDEFEKLQFIIEKLWSGAPSWNPYLTTIEILAHIFSATYYMLDNVVFCSQTYLQNVMGLYPRNRSFRYRDPFSFGTDRIPYSSWPSTTMIKLYTADRQIGNIVVQLVQVRNVVSLLRLVLALGLEMVRIIQSRNALHHLRQELGGPCYREGRDVDVVTAEVALMEAKQKESVVKLIQNACNFFKLIGKLSFEGVISYGFGITERRGAILGCIAQAIGVHRNWPRAQRLKKKHAETMVRLGAPSSPSSRETISLGILRSAHEEHEKRKLARQVAIQPTPPLHEETHSP